MGFNKLEFLDKLEELQTQYAECKIDTEQFEKNLRDLGIDTESVAFEIDAAEDARYNFKLDQAKQNEK